MKAIATRSTAKRLPPLLILAFGFLAFGGHATTGEAAPHATTGEAAPAAPAKASVGPAFTGKLIYHSYDVYGFQGVRSWMVDFDANSVREITPQRLRGAMNYHFNHNGTEVVFMADDGDAPGDEWDLWVASITPTGLSNVTKITPTDGSRDEDPKFSSDGAKIIFKRDLRSIRTIDRSAFRVAGVAQTPPQTTVLSDTVELGMPFFLPGSNADFLYSRGGGNDSSIGKCVNGKASVVYDAPGRQEYYPWGLDSRRFYFTQGISGRTVDGIYLGDTSGGKPKPVAFNHDAYEVADPCVVNRRWIFYSSTRPGGSGNYDIWFGNVATGETYNLNRRVPGANHADRDLGATFHGAVRNTPGPSAQPASGWSQ